MDFYEPKQHSDAEIREAIASNKELVLFLQTSWCGDCKAIKPFVQQYKDLVEEAGATWIDADRDENIAVADENSLRGIPVFVLFKDGEQVSHIGNGQRLNPADVANWIKENV